MILSGMRDQSDSAHFGEMVREITGRTGDEHEVSRNITLFADRFHRCGIESTFNE